MSAVKVRCRVIIILGHKQKKNGEIHPEMIDRMRVGQAFINSLENDIVIFSGGKTRQWCPSEAEQAYDYWREVLAFPIPRKVFLETNSQTTAENIIFSQHVLREQMVDPKKIDEVVFLTRRSAVERAHLLFQIFWKFGNPRFTRVGCLDTKSIFRHCAEKVLRFSILTKHRLDLWNLRISRHPGERKEAV